MDTNAILTELVSIFTDILDIDDIALTPQTHAGDIEEWDSLSHIQLIVAIEKHFKIKFTSLEIQSWKNVGDICVLIGNKLNK